MPLITFFMSSAKRSRSDYTAAQRKAIAINAKLRAKYPYRDWGVAYKKRGTPQNLDYYGETFRTANAEQRERRKADGYIGKGDYKSFMRQHIPTGTFASMGRSLGGLSGIPGMSALGAFAGHKLSNYLGWGDYGGHAGGNQIMAGSTDVPIQVNQSSDLSGDVTIQHREFLGNVTATGVAGSGSAFTAVKYPINPGLTGSFPWLSQIAQNFTLYEFEGCIYEFKPTSGELGSTGSNALGKIVMVTNYDPDAADFTSTVQMENYDYANACKPSQGMLHGVETHPRQKATNLLYVRSGASSKDKIFTDLGSFYIATEGLPITAGTTVNVGELWVTYKIRLSRAQLFSSLLAGSQETDVIIGRSNGTNALGDTVTYLNSLSASTAKYSTPVANYGCGKLTNSLGCTLQGDSGNNTHMTLSFPANIVTGLFLVTFQLTQPVGTANSLATTNAYAFCSLAGVPGLATTYQANATTAEAAYTWTQIVSVNAPGAAIAKIEWFTTTSIINQTVVQVIVTQMPSNIIT